MNTETIERPPVADEVVDAAPANVPALATLRTHALAELSTVERGIAKLKAEYGGTDYDITTPFGYRLATTRRHAIRLVRYQVPKVVKATRAELNEIRDAVATEGERIVSVLQAIEDPHDKAIEAEDNRKAAEKAERERIEAERRARLQAGVDKIRGALARCNEPGMTAERILVGVGMLQRMAIGPEWEDYQTIAKDALAETIEAMLKAHAAALEREAQAEAARVAVEAARVAAEAAEKQRLENERVAAELAERQAKIDAEERRQAEERERQERAAEDARVAKLKADREAEQQMTEGQHPQQVVKAEPATADATDRGTDADVSPSGGSMGAGQAAAAAPAAGALMSLSALCADIGTGISMTATFISAVLKVEPSGTEKRSILYSRDKRLQILAALATRCNQLIKEST